MFKWLKKKRIIDRRNRYEIQYNKDKVSYLPNADGSLTLQVLDGQDCRVVVKMKPGEIVGPDTYGKLWYKTELLDQLMIQCKVDWYSIELRKIIDLHTKEVIWSRGLP